MRMILRPHRFPTVGQCIYCRSKENLTDEHIIARSLAGTFIFDAASCSTCSKVTREIERYCGIIFGPLRVALKFPFNNPPPDVEVTLEFPDRTETRLIPVSRCPAIPVFMPIFPTAGILLGREPRDEIEGIQYKVVQALPADQEERLARFKAEGAKKIEVAPRFGLNPYMRLFAKIAHGFAVAEYGLNSFQPLLPDYILDRDTRLSHIVGSTDLVIQPLPDDSEGNTRSHSFNVGILTHNGAHYVVVNVQLFRTLGFPVYQVVAGIASPELVRKYVGNPKFKAVDTQIGC